MKLWTNSDGSIADSFRAPVHTTGSNRGGHHAGKLRPCLLMENWSGLFGAREELSASEFVSFISSLQAGKFSTSSSPVTSLASWRCIQSLAPEGAQRFSHSRSSFEIPALGQISHWATTSLEPPLCNAPVFPVGRAACHCPHCTTQGQAEADFPFTCEISIDTIKEIKSYKVMIFSYPEMEFSSVKVACKYRHQPKASPHLL